MSCKLKAERAWAAGFFDGEGTPCVSQGGQSIQAYVARDQPSEHYGQVLRARLASRVLERAKLG